MTGSGGQKRIQQLSVVHLSFFDGIGAASLAFLHLGIQPVLTMSWEIDAECIAVLDEHFTPMHMGNITTFNIETFVEAIVDNVDQDEPIMVIATGGPPCPDFSSIKHQPKGSAGSTGHLFQHTVDVLTSIKKALHPVPVHVLLENVVPRQAVEADISRISTQLNIEPVIVDAADGGIIHRRRLWWPSVDWEHVQDVLTHHTPWSCKWMDSEQGWPRLHNPIVATLQPPITTTTHSAPPVLQNQGLFHCLTTPVAPPPPEPTRKHQADNRRFAPWQYQTKYLVTSQQGTTSLAPASMREQMMGFSGSHTANMTHDPTEYHRNKALGNTWHVAVSSSSCSTP